jgi:hypothetical protein
MSWVFRFFRKVKSNVLSQYITYNRFLCETGFRLLKSVQIGCQYVQAGVKLHACGACGATVRRKRYCRTSVALRFLGNLAKTEPSRLRKFSFR